MHTAQSGNGFMGTRSFELRYGPAEVPFVNSELRTSDAIPSASVMSVYMPMRGIGMGLPGKLPSLLSAVTSRGSVMWIMFTFGRSDEFAYVHFPRTLVSNYYAYNKRAAAFSITFSGFVGSSGGERAFIL